MRESIVVAIQQSTFDLTALHDPRQKSVVGEQDHPWTRRIRPMNDAFFAILRIAVVLSRFGRIS